MMLRFCEACNGYSFYFLADLIKSLLVKGVFASYYLILSLPVLYFLFLLTFSLMFLIGMFLIKNRLTEAWFCFMDLGLCSIICLGNSFITISHLIID